MDPAGSWWCRLVKCTMDLEQQLKVSQNLQRIQYFGWWRIESGSGKKRFAYGVYKSFALFWLHFFTLLQLIDLREAVTDLEKLSTNMCGTSVSIVSVIKTVVVLFKADQVEDLHLSLKNNLNMSSVGHDEMDRHILARGCDEIVKLTKMFFSLVIPTIFMWSLLPFIDDKADMKVPLRVWMPLDWSYSPVYELFYAYTAVGLWVFAVNILSQDLFFFGLIIQICSQYEILEKNLRKLDEFCEKTPVLKGTANEKALMMEIKKSIAHHQQILRRIQQVHLIYQNCLFSHFAIALPLLCVIGFNIITALKANGISTHVISQVGYVASTLFDLFFFCIFGERLKQKGLKIAEAVYDGVWYKVGTSPRRLLVVIMARAQNSPGLSAGHVLTINLQSFLQLLRNAYNILTVMNQMTN